MTLRRLVTRSVAVLLWPGGCHSGKMYTGLYIDSYHAGCGPSDDVRAGVEETRAGPRVRLTAAWINPVLAGRIALELRSEPAGRCRRVE